jgi:hypothetical protein
MINVKEAKIIAQMQAEGPDDKRIGALNYLPSVLILNFWGDL